MFVFTTVVVQKQDGTYYSVGSHMGMGKSEDLINWDGLGFTMEGDSYLAPAGQSWKDTLAEPLEWCMKYQRAVVDENGEHIYNDSNYQYNCWANDIIYNPVMGKVLPVRLLLRVGRHSFCNLALRFR